MASRVGAALSGPLADRGDVLAFSTRQQVDPLAGITVN
jgi:hypothetical protein